VGECRLIPPVLFSHGHCLAKLLTESIGQRRQEAVRGVSKRDGRDRCIHGVSPLIVALSGLNGDPCNRAGESAIIDADSVNLRELMGNRLTQIATRTGDGGTTGLGDNQRVSKNSLRVHAMGDVDELNSHIGVLLCEAMPADVRELLVEVQHQLFNLGGELSIPGFELLKPDAVLALDDALAHFNAQLPKLAEFILPAGTRAASQAHVCRTVARRAERMVVALSEQETLNEAPRQYLNRLSDLMFVLARVLNRVDGGDDVYWKSERLARGDD